MGFTDSVNNNHDTNNNSYEINYDAFTFHSITQDDVNRIVNSLQSNKAPGYDKVTAKICSSLEASVASPATIKITTTLECVNVIYFSRNRSTRTTTEYLYKATLEEHAVRSFFCSRGGEGQSFSVPTGGGSVHFRLNYYTVPPRGKCRLDIEFGRLVH